MTPNSRPDTTRKNKRLVNATFHITSHGIDDLQVFETHLDKREFISRIEKHLSRRRFVDGKRRPYKKHCDDVTLISLCIMDNHFHLILHQESPGGMARFMKTLLAGYARDFNQRRNRKGPLFMHRYSATPILDHEHAKRAIAYVHLNHEELQLSYQYMTHEYFIGNRSCDWIDTERGLAIFGGIAGYRRYLERFGPDIVESKAAKRDAKRRHMMTLPD